MDPYFWKGSGWYEANLHPDGLGLNAIGEFLDWQPGLREAVAEYVHRASKESSLETSSPLSTAPSSYDHLSYNPLEHRAPGVAGNPGEVTTARKRGSRLEKSERERTFKLALEFEMRWPRRRFLTLKAFVKKFYEEVFVPDLKEQRDLSSLGRTEKDISCDQLYKVLQRHDWQTGERS